MEKNFETAGFVVNMDDKNSLPPQNCVETNTQKIHAEFIDDRKFLNAKYCDAQTEHGKDNVQYQKIGEKNGVNLYGLFKLGSGKPICLLPYAFTNPENKDFIEMYPFEM